MCPPHNYCRFAVISFFFEVPVVISCWGVTANVSFFQIWIEIKLDFFLYFRGDLYITDKRRTLSKIFFLFDEAEQRFGFCASIFFFFSFHVENGDSRSNSYLKNRNKIPISICIRYQRLKIKFLRLTVYVILAIAQANLSKGMTENSSTARSANQQPKSGHTRVTQSRTRYRGQSRQSITSCRRHN